MKKTLFINHSNNLHGSETVLLELLNVVFTENKNDVYVVEPIAPSQSFFSKALHQAGFTNIIGLPYKNLGVSLLRSIFVLIYNIYSVFYLVRYVRKNKIECIYSNTSVTCLGIIVALITSKPHFWHFHEPVDEKHGFVKSIILIYKFLLRYKRNTLVFVTKTQSDQWHCELSLKNIQSKVIYNPIKEIGHFSKKDDSDTIVFAYMGGRDERKNLLRFIDAFSVLHKENKNTRLLFAKNVGNTNQLIAKKVIDLGLIECFEEKAFPNLSDFYSQIDVFVLPSLSETWGLVVLEALQTKTPVVVTSNTGLTELLFQKKDCIFIDPYNTENIVEAMKFMLNKESREQIAQSGYDTIKEIDFNQNFKLEFAKFFNI